MKVESNKPTESKMVKNRPTPISLPIARAIQGRLHVGGPVNTGQPGVYREDHLGQLSKILTKDELAVKTNPIALVTKPTVTGNETGPFGREGLLIASGSVPLLAGTGPITYEWTLPNNTTLIRTSLDIVFPTDANPVDYTVVAVDANGNRSNPEVITVTGTDEVGPSIRNVTDNLPSTLLRDTPTALTVTGGMDARSFTVASYTLDKVIVKIGSSYHESYIIVNGQGIPFVYLKDDNNVDALINLNTDGNYTYAIRNELSTTVPVFGNETPIIAATKQAINLGVEFTNINAIPTGAASTYDVPVADVAYHVVDGSTELYLVYRPNHNAVIDTTVTWDVVNSANITLSGPTTNLANGANITWEVEGSVPDGSVASIDIRFKDSEGNLSSIYSMSADTEVFNFVDDISNINFTLINALQNTPIFTKSNDMAQIRWEDPDNSVNAAEVTMTVESNTSGDISGHTDVLAKDTNKILTMSPSAAAGTRTVSLRATDNNGNTSIVASLSLVTIDPTAAFAATLNLVSGNGGGEFFIGSSNQTTSYTLNSGTIYPGVDLEFHGIAEANEFIDNPPVSPGSVAFDIPSVLTQATALTYRLRASTSYGHVATIDTQTINAVHQPPDLASAIFNSVETAQGDSNTLLIQNIPNLPTGKTVVVKVSAATSFPGTFQGTGVGNRTFTRVGNIWTLDFTVDAGATVGFKTLFIEATLEDSNVSTRQYTVSVVEANFTTGVSILAAIRTDDPGGVYRIGSSADLIASYTMVNPAGNSLPADVFVEVTTSGNLANNATSLAVATDRSIAISQNAIESNQETVTFTVKDTLGNSGQVTTRSFFPGHDEPSLGGSTVGYISSQIQGTTQTITVSGPNCSPDNDIPTLELGPLPSGITASGTGAGNRTLQYNAIADEWTIDITAGAAMDTGNISIPIVASCGSASSSLPNVSITITPSDKTANITITPAIASPNGGGEFFIGKNDQVLVSWSSSSIIPSGVYVEVSAPTFMGANVATLTENTVLGIDIPFESAVFAPGSTHAVNFTIKDDLGNSKAGGTVNATIELQPASFANATVTQIPAVLEQGESGVIRITGVDWGSNPDDPSLKLNVNPTEGFTLQGDGPENNRFQYAAGVYTLPFTAKEDGTPGSWTRTVTARVGNIAFGPIVETTTTGSKSPVITWDWADRTGDVVITPNITYGGATLPFETVYIGVTTVGASYTLDSNGGVFPPDVSILIKASHLSFDPTPSSTGANLNPNTVYNLPVADDSLIRRNEGGDDSRAYISFTAVDTHGHSTLLFTKRLSVILEPIPVINNLTIGAYGESVNNPVGPTVTSFPSDYKIGSGYISKSKYYKIGATILPADILAGTAQISVGNINANGSPFNGVVVQPHIDPADYDVRGDFNSIPNPPAGAEPQVINANGTVDMVISYDGGAASRYSASGDLLETLITFGYVDLLVNYDGADTHVGEFIPLTFAAAGNHIYAAQRAFSSRFPA